MAITLGALTASAQQPSEVSPGFVPETFADHLAAELGSQGYIDAVVGDGIGSVKVSRDGYTITIAVTLDDPEVNFSKMSDEQRQELCDCISWIFLDMIISDKDVADTLDMMFDDYGLKLVFTFSDTSGHSITHTINTLE